jgi:crotonobetainyl-CoA:carnitine CoA-transferase CaiB-like acyl-CoA transferase
VSPADAPRQRALDVSSGVAAAYAARLLAEVGWDVVKVEPADGDPLRSEVSRWGGGAGGAFLVANAGKRSVSIPHDRLLALAAEADVVIGDFSAGGLRHAQLPEGIHGELSPRASVVSVTPFGLTGPKAGWVASELVVQAASGLMFLTGEWDQPPMQLPPYQGALAGGLAAASATLAAVLLHRRDGKRHDADVSMVEALASHGYGQHTAYVLRGEVARREQRIKAGLRMVPAKDRFVYCAPGAVASMRMDGIAELIGEPKLAEERFQTAEGRMNHYDEFVELFVPPFTQRTAQEWFERAEQMHMTFALVQTIDDLFECPQLEAREFLRTVEAPDGTAVRIPGRPFRLEGGPPATELGPPRTPGMHTDEVVAEWLGE